MLNLQAGFDGGLELPQLEFECTIGISVGLGISELCYRWSLEHAGGVACSTIGNSGYIGCCTQSIMQAI